MTSAGWPRRLAARLCLSGALAGATGVARAEVWDFVVQLDGKPIGSHRFVVEGPPEARQVRSTARFDVTLLGLTVFRYRHEASERWRGDCLQEIHSLTDDDGKPVRVDLRLDAGVPDAQDASLKWSCVMSYAYWHPVLVRQQRLLNPQTGEMDELRVERLPEARIAVAGREVEAVRWRLTATSPRARTPPQVLTLWLDREDGRWIGLDAQVRGGRVLTYRQP